MRPKTPAVLMPDRLDEFLPALSVVERRVSSTDRPLTLIVPDEFKHFAVVITSLPMISDRRGTARERRHTIRRIREERFTHLYVLRPHSTWLCLRSGVPWFRRRVLSLDCRRCLARKRRGRQTVPTDDILRCMGEVLEWKHTTPYEWNGVSIAHDNNDKNSIVIGLDEGLSCQERNAIVDYAQKLYTKGFVIIGPPGCASVAKTIRDGAPGNVQNLCGNSNWNSILHIVASSDVLISGNTEYLHLAGYLGIQWLALHRPDIVTGNTPIGTGGTVLCNRGESISYKSMSTGMTTISGLPSDELLLDMCRDNAVSRRTVWSTSLPSLGRFSD